eukprot:gb/GECG01000161.1/.p1 GENE.gb/GECG01000161.1/~~gb/GECG01000161.1/.p1  ORF type:complete len:169 (+),score=11.90 gb/GECG01000161.1/:1-507(+)
MTPVMSEPKEEGSGGGGKMNIQYRQYRDDNDLPKIMELVSMDLSEPYTIFTYRYFIHNWPSLCYLAMDGETIIGTIVCKAERHKGKMRGYIAMLAVSHEYRKQGIGSHLVSVVLSQMAQSCDEIVLEAESTNKGALRLYENLGFLRAKLLPKYYLNGNDAYRLKLWLR